MVSWQDLLLVAGWLGLTVATGRAVAKWLWRRALRWAVESLTSPFEKRLADVEGIVKRHVTDRFRHGGTEE